MEVGGRCLGYDSSILVTFVIILLDWIQEPSSSAISTMSSSSRWVHRKNIYQSGESEGQSDERRPPVDSFEDDDKHRKGRRVFGGRKRAGSNAHRRLSRSETVIDALEDTNSELARFLFLEQNTPVDNRIIWKSLRSIENFAVGNNEDMRSMRTSLAWFYSLALEPMSVRSERIIMLSEAYAIFGALFLAGTWVLYEWGSNWGEVCKNCPRELDGAFQVVMSLDIIANLFMAMFASFLWLFSVLFSGSDTNFVFQARYMCLFLHILLCTIFVLTSAGIAIAIYTKLAPSWIQMAIAHGFLLTSLFSGVWTTSFFLAEEFPLEYFHFPLWFKYTLIPYPMLFQKSRQRIREGALQRAKDLRRRAYEERNILNDQDEIPVATTSSGRLLRSCADMLGKNRLDVQRYEAKLLEDWLDDVEDLTGLSANDLMRYMPRKLAEMVFSVLHSTEPAEGNPAASGQRVSWDTSDKLQD